MEMSFTNKGTHIHQVISKSLVLGKPDIYSIYNYIYNMNPKTNYM